MRKWKGRQCNEKARKAQEIHLQKGEEVKDRNCKENMDLKGVIREDRREAESKISQRREEDREREKDGESKQEATGR